MREEIIKMAREAGLPYEYDTGRILYLTQLERFFHMAQAAEREANIKIIEEYRIPVGNSSAGEMACEWTYDALKEIRDDIRARGQA